MTKSTTAISIIILTVTACIDAPRDNKYDPENPNRAYLSAFVYELGFYPMDDAIVSLSQDGASILSDTSDSEGIVQFEEITPGIYDIDAHAQYYTDVDYPPESLWADVIRESLRIEFTKLNFEDDVLGEPSPHAFEVSTGPWAIALDTQQPYAHSVPQVYRATVGNANDTAITLFQTEAECFFFKTHIKIDSLSAATSRAGVIIRYQDDQNYYAITLSPDSIFCDMILNGQKTAMHAEAYESGPGIWHEICIERPDGWFFARISLDAEIVYSIYDDDLSEGQPGLIVCTGDGPGQAVGHFDDITLDLTYGLPE